MDVALIGMIINFRRLTERIATAGQPTEEELAAVAAAGYEAVINLGQAEAEYALADEGASVRALGMEYLHIPVANERPVLCDLHAFMDALDAHADRRLFIHCAANRRVSVFVALYRVLRLGWVLEDAMRPVLDVWEPDPVWMQFVVDMTGVGSAAMSAQSVTHR